jgi:hypothetical protein
MNFLFLAAGGTGRCKLRCQVVRASDPAKVLSESEENEMNFEAEHKRVVFSIAIPDIVFGEPGLYAFQVFVDGRRLDFEATFSVLAGPA